MKIRAAVPEKVVSYFLRTEKKQKKKQQKNKNKKHM